MGPGGREGLLHAHLERVARGDRAAFRALYDLTSQRLFSITLRLVGNREVAEDVLQECYMTIWTRAARYRAERGRVLTWMQAIARHKAIDRLRAAHHRPQVELDDVADLAPDPAAGDLTLRRCLEALGEEQRRAILLVFYTGLTHEELSERIQAPLGTVKSRIRRGLLALRECIDA